MLTDGAVRTDSGKLFRYEERQNWRHGWRTLCCLLSVSNVFTMSQSRLLSTKSSSHVLTRVSWQMSLSQKNCPDSLTDYFTCNHDLTVTNTNSELGEQLADLSVCRRPDEPNRKFLRRVSWPAESCLLVPEADRTRSRCCKSRTSCDVILAPAALPWRPHDAGAAYLPNYTATRRHVSIVLHVTT